MWNTKTFRSINEMNVWIEANQYKMQIEEIAINNGWGVTYRKLIRVY